MSAKATSMFAGTLVLLMAAMGSDWNVAEVGLIMVCTGVVMHFYDRRKERRAKGDQSTTAIDSREWEP